MGFALVPDCAGDVGAGAGCLVVVEEAGGYGEEIGDGGKDFVGQEGALVAEFAFCKGVHLSSERLVGRYVTVRTFPYLQVWALSILMRIY